MSENKVLITGGGGFIGSHLVARLRADGFAIRILDSLSPQIHGAVPQGLGWLVDQNVEFIRGSVTSRDDVIAALSGVDHVVHFAAETGTGQSMYEVERYCTTNVLGTAMLIDVLGTMPERTVKRVVLASSRSVYGEGAYNCPHCGNARLSPAVRPMAQLRRNEWEPKCPDCEHELVALPTREDDPVRPASIYAATKYAQEDLVRIGCEAMGLGYVLFRFQNVYGERQSLKNPYTGILSIFSTRVRRKLVLPIFEDGKESRDFVHVGDVVEAVRLGLVSPAPANDVFNVGNGVSTSVYDLAVELSLALGGEPRVEVTGQFRAGDIRHNCADLGKIGKSLNYVPAIGLKEGLRRFAGWVLEQPLPEDQLEQANLELKKRKLMG